MNPLSLYATAYRTYSDLTLDYPDGVCAITGELAGEPGKSNGSGKSSIANAIDLALFGAQSRTLADEHNPAYGETMLLALVFGHGINEYRVRRTYSAKGRGTTTVDLEEGDGGMSEQGNWIPSSDWRPLTRESAAATQALLEQILGLSRPTFRASSFLAQGDGAAFTTAQPRERKRILAEVLGLQVWDGLLEKARHERRETDMRMVSIGGFVERSEPELAQRDGMALQLDQARENEQATQSSLAEATARLATAREALVEARGRVERRAGAENALQRAEAALSVLRTGISVREGALRALDDRLASRSDLEEDLCDEAEAERQIEGMTLAAAAFSERQRLREDRAALALEREELVEKENDLLTRAAIALEGAGSETCDRCGQTLHEEAARIAADSLKAEAAEHHERAHRKYLDLGALDKKIINLPDDAPHETAIPNARARLEASRTARTQLAALDEAQTRRDELAAEIQKMRAELPEREQDVVAARAELEALGPHDPDAAQAAFLESSRIHDESEQKRRDLDVIGREIARLEERLARLDTLAGEVHLATRERDSLRDEQELLTALERAYGPNGIPAFIVENTAIPQIEAEACRILRDLGTEYQVELHTQRETKAGGVTDALDIVVYDGIRARPYEGFSGGEKTRIELALRIALAHLLANRRGAESRVLVIDEPDGLDSAGMAALADVLRRLHADGVFEKILLVSHVAELRDAFEASIHVVCENGVSRVDGAREMVTA